MKPYPRINSDDHGCFEFSKTSVLASQYPTDLLGRSRTNKDHPRCDPAPIWDWGYRSRQKLVRIAISRPFVSLYLGGGGGPESILFSLFWNKKASFKGIDTLNDIHI